MTPPEFSRPIRIDTIGGQKRALTIAAAADERAALAQRFGLVALDRLEAELTLTRNGDEVTMQGKLQAQVVQACVASGVPVPGAVDVPFDILFRPHAAGPGDEEVELGEGDLDVVFYGRDVDVGEAVAETLSLNLDPWPRAPEADAILREAGVKQEGEEEKGPLAAALSGLKDRLRR